MNIEDDLKKDMLRIAIPAIFLMLLNLFFVLIIWGFIGIQYRNGAIVFEFLVTFIMTAFFLGILKKGKRVIIVLGGFFWLLGILNFLKVFYAREPILLTDVFYLNDFGEIFQIVEGDVWNDFKPYIFQLVVYSISFLVTGIIGVKLWSNIEIKNIKQRISLIVVPLFIMIILFLPISFLNNFFLNNVYHINDRKDYDGFESILEYYVVYGVFGGMYGQFLEDRVTIPEDYDEALIENELGKCKENTEKKFGTPNIIVVFSESFFDIDQLDEIEFNTKVTPNFNSLKEKGLFFNMISPSYGGISANVEYEFLTGANLMYFNRGYIPYMQLYRNDKYYEVPSIIGELKNNGYKTHITSFSSPNLFNCKKFYQYSKVDETEYNKDVDDKYKAGLYVSDEYVTDKIIETFDHKPEKSKLFYMTLTMQAHMPYPEDKYDNYDVYVTNSHFSQDDNNVISSYAQGIYDADKQLGRLYEYIQTLDEPTIIVFYGDHLPYLYGKNGNIINQMDYFNTDDKLLNDYRLYNTQSLIVANFDLEKDEETKYLGPDLLSAYVLNNMDIEISDYYKWLYNTKDCIGAANYLVTEDADGNLYNTNQLSGKYKELYNLRRMIQYKLFIK